MDKNTFTQEIRCFNCAYVLSACICPGKPKAAQAAKGPRAIIAETYEPVNLPTLAGIRAAAHRGEQVSLAELAQAQRREQQPKRTRANAEALSLTEQAEESILDDILDATQKHMAGFTAAMPASVQAKRETQKRLPLAPSTVDRVAALVQATPAPKKRSLSDLASLL